MINKNGTLIIYKPNQEAMDMGTSPTTLRNFMETLVENTIITIHGPEWLTEISCFFQKCFSSSWDEALEKPIDNNNINLLYQMCSPNCILVLTVRTLTSCHITVDELQYLQKEILELAEMEKIKVDQEKINEETIIYHYLTIALDFIEWINDIPVPTEKAIEFARNLNRTKQFFVLERVHHPTTGEFKSTGENIGIIENESIDEVINILKLTKDFPQGPNMICHDDKNKYYAIRPIKKILSSEDLK